MKPIKSASQEEWLSARKALLEKEKAHMREGDRLAAERRELPWLKIKKRYTFETEHGRKTLAELFHGRGQLIVRLHERGMQARPCANRRGQDFPDGDLRDTP